MGALRFIFAAVVILSSAFPALAVHLSLPAAVNITSNAVIHTATNRKLMQYGSPVPLDSSVVLLFVSDVEGGQTSPCVRMVDRIKSFGGRAVNFVITAYYADYNGDNTMDKLGYMESPLDKKFREYTPAAASRWQAGLAFCMRYAVNNGFYIVLHPHLDDGLYKGTWRNVLVFDPSAKYGAMSYFDAVIRPAANAIKQANSRGKEVYISLQAEMGATLFYYPRQYRNMVNTVKDIVAGGGTAKSKVKIGVNVNWEKICGCPSDLIYSVDYMTDFRKQWNIIKSTINIGEVQALFKSVDWIGVSAYAGLPHSLSVDDLETSCAKVDQELNLYGLSLKSLNKEIILSEYGLGGGQSNDYKTPALSSYNVALSPYWGVEGTYSTALDPWNRADNRQFMRRFYELTIKYAKRGGGPRYKVTAIYIWNIISYDIQGVHYMSTNNQGSYRDDYVSGLITSYNQGIRGN
eukprot:jgi/Chrzof1/15262/UNPLg00656.t1